MRSRIRLLLLTLVSLHFQITLGNVTGPPTAFGMRFRLPFIDIDIQSVSNVRIIKDTAGQQVYILHGAEFYQLTLERDVKRITLIATLNGEIKDSELLGAEIISWRDYVLLVVAVEESMEVYQFAKKTINDLVTKPLRDDEGSLVMDPIQQITLYGRYRNLYLCEPSPNNVTLIVLVNFTKLYSRLNVYSWSETYFDPSEEMTIAPIQSSRIIGSESKYLVIGRKSKGSSKVTVTVYKISSSIKQVQSMQVVSQVFHTFTYQATNYLLSCAADDKRCALYKMTNDRFSVYKHRSASEFHFDRFTAGDHFLIGQRGDDVLVFVDSRMECYGSFKTEAKDVTSIVIHLNEKGHEFILINYVRPLSALIRIVEVEYGQVSAASNENDNGLEEGGTQEQYKNSLEANIMGLRLLLLSRSSVFDEIKRNIAAIRKKRKEVMFVKPIRIVSGYVGTVLLTDSKLRRPLRIMQGLKALLGGQRRPRFSREFDKTSSVGLRVQSLHVGNLIYDDDLVPGLSLNIGGDHLRISRSVTTKLLKTNELITAGSMEPGRSHQVKTRSSSESIVKFQDLKANRINDIPWDAFIQNTFLRSRDRLISGRLIMQSRVHVNKLKTVILNSVPAAKIFNLVEAQNVTSNIFIPRAIMKELVVNELNGLDFVRDVASKGVDNFIQTPVTAVNIRVSNKFILAEKDHRARHIFGTNVLDFQQTYTGKVVIKGSLTVVNLKTKAEEGAEMFVGNRQVSKDLLESFWRRATPQIFSSPMTFSNCRVSAPIVNTTYLNGWPTTEYFQKSKTHAQKSVLLIFLSASIDGDLTADSQFKTKLREISENAVTTDSDPYVSGDKIFHGTLTIDHANFTETTDRDLNDLISKDENICVFRGTKSFKSIHVIDTAVITENLDLVHFGDHLNVSDLLHTPLHFGLVVLKTPLKAENVVFDYFNGFPWNRLLNGIHSVDDKLLLDRDLYVVGSIQFDANVQVDTINYIDWEEYLSSLIRFNENALITGMKIIDHTLTISSYLNTSTINDISIDELFQNVLLKSHYQKISGSYTFDRLRLNNVNASFINEFPTNAFIDTRVPEIVINGDVIAKNLQVQGSLFGLLSIDFYTLEHRIKATAQKPWKHLRVLEDAIWPWSADQQSLNLQYLTENAVRHLDDQIITGNVKLRKPLIITINTKYTFPTEIDFDLIATDCLFYNSSITEVVTAIKTFTKPIQIAEVTTESLVRSPIVNTIDILKYNSSLYRFSSASIISGPLIFKTTPVFGHLTVQGVINNVLPKKIFIAEDNRVLPPVKLKSLYVDHDLQLHDIDRENFDSLLQTRVRKSGASQEVYGHITFEQLILKEDIHLQSINNIAIDNLIHKHSTDSQVISGHKSILGDLQLVGPTTVTRLNGEDVLESYRHSIFLNKNYNFDSLSIQSARFENGLIIRSPHSQRPHIDKPYESIHKENIQRHKGVLERIRIGLSAVEDVIDMKMINPKRLVYLDYDFSTIIEWKSSNDSIQERFIFDNNRYQLCDREKTIVKWSKHHNRLLLNTFKTNTITAEEYGVHASAENICKDSYRNAMSLITITEPHFSKTFQITKLVQSIDIFYARDIYILIHAIDMYAGNNEIRTFKIDSNYKTIQDWQLLMGGVGKVSKLFKLPTHTILLVSTVIDNYPSTTVYNLNSDSRTFEAIQIIDGDFDVIELVQVTPYTYHLFLSCVHCQRIVIFEYDSRMLWVKDYRMYRIYQIIKLKTRIDRLSLFTLPDGGIYMLVLADQDIDFYHVYKYRYIQGWQHFTYGYFKNIQNAYPLLKSGVSCVDDNLLLLCNRKCTLVKAFYQG